MTLKQATITISGHVQGVFYRSHAQEEAKILALTGYVKNLPNGNVEALAQGTEEQINSFIEWARKGSPSAHVDNVDVTWQEIKQKFIGFEIF